MSTVPAGHSAHLQRDALAELARNPPPPLDGTKAIRVGAILGETAATSGTTEAA